MLNKKLVKSTVALLAMPALFGLVNVSAGEASVSPAVSGSVKITAGTDQSESTANTQQVAFDLNTKTTFDVDCATVQLFFGAGTPNALLGTQTEVDMDSHYAMKVSTEYAGIGISAAYVDGPLVVGDNGDYVYDSQNGSTTSGLPNVRNLTSDVPFSNDLAFATFGLSTQFGDGHAVTADYYADQEGDESGDDHWLVLGLSGDMAGVGYSLKYGFGEGDSFGLGEGIANAQGSAQTQISTT